MKVRPKVKRIVGLTGTPSSNGLMDLWAEFRLLDMGERLGRFIGQYRTSYFRPDKQNGQVVFSYKPLPGAEKQIYGKISDITISMKSTDHLRMPELVDSRYTVYLSEQFFPIRDHGTDRGRPYCGESIQCGGHQQGSGRFEQFENR